MCLDRYSLLIRQAGVYILAHICAVVELSEIEAGVVVGGHRWPAPVVIKKATRMGDDVHIIGSTTTGLYVDAVLSSDEISDVRLEKIACDFSSRPWAVFLALEATRYKFASDYDPWLAMNISKIVPLPHQIEAVYGTVLKMPRIRFILAHDPGAGKTIMAGLIIKELKLRHMVTRILIVVPGHLRDQWRRELYEKFDEEFVVVDRSVVHSTYGQNTWRQGNQLITSMDFAKQTDVRPSIESAQFDLVIVDEAHKMAANLYGDQIKRTDRYKLGETLSKNTEHYLFLTATPHKGDPDNFRLFLDLLEPGFFATPKILSESIEERENLLFLRRIKEEMKDFDGKPLFLPRYVETTSYTLSPLERDLYRNVTDYVRSQYNKALTSGRRRSVGFALLILQRRLASSCYALWLSLSRRRDTLKKMLDSEKRPAPLRSSSFDFEIEDTDEMLESERWEQEKLAEEIILSANRSELHREISSLEKLILQAKSIIEQENEIKLKTLRKTMTLLEQKSINKKILIFTESKDTLEYLVKKIKSWGYTANYIHGNMNHDERIAAENVFKTTDTKIMVATEAAGEGINLQFCHLMINYDLPWTPTRLEQRMGRIHRYGQQHEVYVYNLIVEDTVEGRIFKALFDKLEEIKKRMGNDKVYDIIGEIYRDKDLAAALADAAVDARTEGAILSGLEAKANKALDNIKESLNETLATKHIEFTEIKKQRQLAQENKLMPEYTRGFFLMAFTKAGGNVKKKSDDTYAIDTIPHSIKKIADADAFKQSHGVILKSYPRAVFAKSTGPSRPDIHCLTFGHPLFEAVLEWVSHNFEAELQKGAEFVDPCGRLDGVIFFYEGKVTDGLGATAGKRLFACYVDSNTRRVDSVPPSILWDLQGSNTRAETVNKDDFESKALPMITHKLKNYLQDLSTERERRARIMTKRGLKSLDILIADLDKDLVALKKRKAEGEPNLDLAIWNKADRQRTYVEKRTELTDTIKRETVLTRNAPYLKGVVRVRPPENINDDLKEDDDVEAVAMQTAIDYERCHGRVPEDVSRVLGLGYDIRSVDTNGNVRYIEVKGRGHAGQVAVTKNEWIKAKQLARDYYLYVVWNASSRSNLTTLKIVRDPANCLHPSEDICYFVSKQEIEALTHE